MRRKAVLSGTAFTAAALIAALAAWVPPGVGSAPETAGAAGVKQLQGYWRSVGYGLLLEFDGNTLRILQTTAISCAPAAVATRVPRFGSRNRAVYVVDPSRSLPFFAADSDKLVIAPGRAPSKRRLQVPSATSDIGIERIGDPPNTCAKRDRHGPRRSFDIFWRTYAENYPFFDLHDVDWNAERARVRGELDADTGRRRLFSLLRSAIRPLGDAHTFLWVPGLAGAFYLGERPDPQPIYPKDFQRAREITAGYLTTPLRSFAQAKVSFARLPDSVGYLQIRSFQGYSKRPGINAQRRALDQALDAALSRPLEGLVIDLRRNGGGSDVPAIDIASRLTDRRYLAYSKLARDPQDPSGFTESQRVLVEPSDDSPFTGPVALLTSRYSHSAAECFAQALIPRDPEVARIGESTQGIFSDVLIRSLPNGLLFGLPNEIYVTAGRTYDGTGIPPTIDTGLVFDRANLEAGRDPELEQALALFR